MNKEELISEVLRLPYTAIEYSISERLAKLFPDKGLIEGNNFGYFDVETYVEAGQCVLTAKTFLHNQKMTYWMQPEAEVVRRYRGHMHVAMSGMSMGQAPTSDSKDGEKSIGYRYKKAWLTVEWQEASLDLLLMQFDDGNYHKSMFWLLADSEEVARNFLDAVCRWNMEIRGEVLVFDNGHWHKDEHLYQDIKDATFDNLILRGSLKQDIRDDLAQFFATRDMYEEYGIPWKRGILFVGPPGNGKTHTVKALINSMAQPCLYVKSLKLGGAPDDLSIRLVFERARKTAPCILVLEDLDAQLSPQNRSFFLNELDGFAANIGIVTLATTNHPERLDPAILDRPSRFDRKYPFDLPEVAERKAYIAMWNASLKPALRLSEEGIARLSELTEGFSFAYLKELFLSSMMRWIAKPLQGTMEEVMSGQVNVLREQMASSVAYQEAEPPDMPSMPPGFHTGMFRSGMMRLQEGM